MPVRLTVDGDVVDTVTSRRSRPARQRSLAIRGPECGRLVRLEADPGRRIVESSEDDNVHELTCADSPLELRGARLAADTMRAVSASPSRTAPRPTTARGHQGRAHRRPGRARGRDDARHLHLGGGGAQAVGGAARRGRRRLEGGGEGRDRGDLGAARLVDEAPPAAAVPIVRGVVALGRVAQDRLQGARHLGQRADARPTRRASSRTSAAAPGSARSCSRCCSRSGCSSCCPPA